VKLQASREILTERRHACLSVCLSVYSVYLSEPVVEFHSRVANDRSNNVYGFHGSPLGGEDHSSRNASDVCRAAAAANAADVYDEESAGLLNGLKTVGTRPKMAIPNTIPCDNNDNDGYMIPSFKAERNDLRCSHYYNSVSVQRDDGTYLEPNENNIYEDIETNMMWWRIQASEYGGLFYIYIYIYIFTIETM